MQDGADDVRGRVACELRDPLPQVRLDDLEPEVSVVFLKPSVQLDLLGRHALGLGDDLRALSPRKVPNVAYDVLPVPGEEDVAAARLDGIGHLFQITVEVGHRLLLYAVCPLPELGRLGQGVQPGVARGDGLVGEELHGVVELLVRDGPARPFVEALDAAGDALVAMVLRLAPAGRLLGLHALNQPFRRWNRGLARGEGRGCRVRCV